MQHRASAPEAEGSSANGGDGLVPVDPPPEIMHGAEQLLNEGGLSMAMDKGSNPHADQPPSPGSSEDMDHDGSDSKGNQGKGEDEEEEEGPRPGEGGRMAEQEATSPGGSEIEQAHGKRAVSAEDIQLVQNLIERCLQLYMTQVGVTLGF